MTAPAVPEARELELVDCAALVLDPDNARRHPPANIDAIAASLVAFGQVGGIAVRRRDALVLAGNGRLMAARQLGWAQLRVWYVPDAWSEAECRAFALADNRTAELAEWDASVYRSSLSELRAEGWDMTAFGFSAGAALELEDPGPGEAPEVPVTEEGDLWALGPHRLLCGDSRAPASFERLLGDELVAAVWTDPPYGVEYSSGAGAMAGDVAGSEHLELLGRALGATAAVMLPGAPIYVAHADSARLEFTRAFVGAGFKLSGVLVWVKSSATLGRSDYQWQHEPVLYGWKPGARHPWHGGRKQTTVIDAGLEELTAMGEGAVLVRAGSRTLVLRGEGLTVEEVTGTVIELDKPTASKLHPTMKPTALVERCLSNSCGAGALVLDPFAGSGTTLIAAHRLSLPSRLIELEPRFCDVIVARWQAMTGDVATCGEKRIS